MLTAIPQGCPCPGAGGLQPQSLRGACRRPASPTHPTPPLNTSAEGPTGSPDSPKFWRTRGCSRRCQSRWELAVASTRWPMASSRSLPPCSLLLPHLATHGQHRPCQMAELRSKRKITLFSTEGPSKGRRLRADSQTSAPGSPTVTQFLLCFQRDSP